MTYTDFRLKIRRWFRKYSKLVLVLFLGWFTIFIINYYMNHQTIKPEPETTYEMHTSVMDTRSAVPTSIQDTIEEMIDEYVRYCNEGNFQKAFNMLSEDCQKYEYDNNVVNFMQHVYTKMPTKRHHAIQNYSNTQYDGNKLYIYEIKYTDDLLATGLTNATYAFTSEKMVFYNENDEVKMNVGDYVYHSDIKKISENEYLKIDVIDKIANYSSETYQVKFTNRSNYTVVIADGVETDEINLVLPNETRQRGSTFDIVLNPQESQTYTFEFPKFMDDGDISQSLLFSSIRVMEQYSGTDEIAKEVIQSEIDNAISKFSMTVGL